jgi:hypothetical protein
MQRGPTSFLLAYRIDAKVSRLSGYCPCSEPMVAMVELMLASLLWWKFRNEERW